MIKRFFASNMMSKSKFIKLTEPRSAGVIQLHRPEALNAINSDMFTELHRLIKSLENVKDVVIFKGSGKVFSAGGDVKQTTSRSHDEVMKSYTTSSCTLDLLSNYKKPFVVLIDGLAMGGAAIYAMPGRYRVATEKASFSMPETAIGYFNDAGASYFLPRLDNYFGFYIGMTGTRVKGFDMKKVNLSTHFVDSSKLNDLEEELTSCKSHSEVENTLNKFSSTPQSNETELDSLMPSIEKCFGGSSVEQIYENLHEDGSEWAMKTINILNKMSPTSLKVTHRSMTLGRELSLHECLKMEYRLVAHHIADSDFKEGVRAMLKDKDFNPQWKPKTLNEVTEEHVEKFFGPLSSGDELVFEESLPNKL